MRDMINQVDLWRNGSASDSRSEGCVFDSRQVQFSLLECGFHFMWRSDFFGVEKFFSYLGFSKTKRKKVMRKVNNFYTFSLLGMGSLLNLYVL